LVWQKYPPYCFYHCFNLVEKKKLQVRPKCSNLKTEEKRRTGGEVYETAFLAEELTLTVPRHIPLILLLRHELEKMRDG
jgi:hypothetical protein